MFRQRVHRLTGYTLFEDTSSRGGPTDKVRFTSNAGSPAKGDWGYIKFADSSTDATFDGAGGFIGGSVLEHCIVAFGGGVGSAGQLFGAVWADSASPFISGCEVRSSAVNGVRVTPGGGLRFIGNTLAFNAGPGLVATGTVSLAQDAVFTISKNVVSNNGSSTVGALTIALGFVGAGAPTTTISENTIQDNAGPGAGLELGGGGNRFVVSQNSVLGNAGAGISACCDNEIFITNNLIFGNAAGGVHARASFGDRVTTISGNRIVGNTMSDHTGPSLVHIHCDGGDCANNQSLPTITGNNMQDNTTQHWLYNSTDAGSDNVDATNNWWGTSTDAVIQSRVHDANDDAARGLVTYIPFLGAPSTVPPPSAPVGVAAETGMTSVTLTWQANPESDVVGYKVHWDTDATGSLTPARWTSAARPRLP